MSQDTEKTKKKKQQGTLLPAHTTSLHRYLAEISNYPVLSREEEFKLAKPANCEAYQKGSLKPEARDWHFCRLQEVVARESALSLPPPPPSAPPARGAPARAPTG